MEPFNIGAEQSVLGGLLRNNDAIDHVPELRADHFYRAEHQVIFSEMLAQIAAGHKFDVITMAEKLRGKVEDAAMYLMKMEQGMPSAANIAYHAGIVVEKASKRALAALSGEMLEWVHSASESATCIDLTAARLEQIAHRPGTREPQRMDSTLEAYLGVLQNRMDGKVKPIPTGFEHLDDQLDGGLERGTLTVIAGRPGTGKTAAGLGICRNVAHDNSALFLSMEMSITQVNDRNISALARIPMRWLRKPSESARDTERWTQISHAVGLSRSLNLFIDDQTALSLMDIRAKARKIKRLHGLDVLCVDQLSFMTGARSDKLHEAMGEYTRGLIAIAKELDIAVILLAQLNRDCEKRMDKRPIMSDLGVSGYIEQDAANIILLYRDALWNPDSPDKDICEWNSVKQRQGSPGVVGLTYIGEQTRFECPSYRWQRKLPAAPEKGERRLNERRGLS